MLSLVWANQQWKCNSFFELNSSQEQNKARATVQCWSAERDLRSTWLRLPSITDRAGVWWTRQEVLLFFSELCVWYLEFCRLGIYLSVSSLRGKSLKESWRSWVLIAGAQQQALGCVRLRFIPSPAPLGAVLQPGELAVLVKWGDLLLFISWGLTPAVCYTWWAVQSSKGCPCLTELQDKLWSPSPSPVQQVPLLDLS